MELAVDTIKVAVFVGSVVISRVLRRQCSNCPLEDLIVSRLKAGVSEEL
jgi:hypothetical protein